MPNFVENPNYVIAAARRNSTTAIDNLRFPASEAIPYVMLMNFKEYIYSENIGLGTENFANEISKGSIVLPLPLQLRDSVGIEASSVSGNIAAITSTAADFGSYQGGEDFESNARFYADLMKNVAGSAAAATSQLKGPIAAALTTFLGGTAVVSNQVAGTTGSLLLGKAINSFETMEFKGVKLKSHSFNWRLSPSSQKDSDALRDVIKEIKKNMLPAYVGAAGPAALTHALLKYPKLVMVTFLGINQDYYYKLKPCMITGFDVRYNGGEQLNVFKGGKPVVVELSLEMTEVQIHTSDDYGGGADTIIPLDEPISNPNQFRQDILTGAPGTNSGRQPR
jgi:hypothetical protein